MKARKAITAGLLVICGALVFLVISRDEAVSADAILEKASAHSVANFGDTVYKISTADYSKLDVGEFWVGLEAMIKENPLLSSEEKQDWIGCILEQDPANDCDLIRSVDYCADQFPPKQPLNSYSEDAIKHFANYLASQLVSFKVNIGDGGESATLVQNEDWFENDKEYFGFCYEEGKCPRWYYHFVAGDTYLEIVYQQDAGAVSGNIVFSVIGALPKEFQVEWETQHTQDDDPQRIDISCRVTFDFLNYCGDENSHHTVMDDWLKAILVYYYWSKADKGALDTLNKYNFEGWWIKQLQDNLAIYIASRLIDLFTPGDLCTKYQPVEAPSDTDEEGSDILWDRSPLLIFTVNPDLWKYLKHPEYFDHISLSVDENAEEKMKELTVKLNNITILVCSDTQMPPLCDSMTMHQNQSVNLDSATEEYRLQRLGLNLSSLPEVPRELLTAAAKNLGQAWDYGYASRWDNVQEDSTLIWKPRPIVRCSEYVCRMIEKGYTELPPMSKSCENLEVCPDMWDYFGDPNNDGNSSNNVRISPFDWNPREARKYEWSDLYDEDLGTSIIKPGYYTGMSWKDEGGEGDKIYHSTFFVRWNPSYLPRDERCFAKFYAIGGNQGGGKITITDFVLCNAQQESCLEQCKEEEAAMFWGDNCNFFAKTYEE